MKGFATAICKKFRVQNKVRFFNKRNRNLRVHFPADFCGISLTPQSELGR
jgi:hypothetical protein